MSSNQGFAAEFAHLDVVSGDVEEERADDPYADHDDDLALDSDAVAKACMSTHRASQTGPKTTNGSVDVGSDDEFVSDPTAALLSDFEDEDNGK